MKREREGWTGGNPDGRVGGGKEGERMGEKKKGGSGCVGGCEPT